MVTQEQTNYDRIAKAIGFIHQNFKEQPTLEEIAAEVALSPFHFQRLFTEWAGVSPKKFLQFITVQHAKDILKESRTTVFDAAFETGLSGTGRLHDLFLQIEGMTPGEYKNGGEALSIRYNFRTTIFGQILIASTSKGVCHLAFTEEPSSALAELRLRFPNAGFEHSSDGFQEQAVSVFGAGAERPSQVKLHLKGTPFQLKVWEALLNIPMGGLATYGSIAGRIGTPQASRAVGSAVGDNPVAFIIPCHRVIQSTGVLGNYRWGSVRKMAMVGWEAAQSVWSRTDAGNEAVPGENSPMHK